MLLISASKGRKISVSSKPIKPGLHCQFQVSQDCRVRPCLKTTKPNKYPWKTSATEQIKERTEYLILKTSIETRTIQ